MKENKYYTKKWFDENLDGDIHPFSTLEAAGDAQELHDNIAKLFEEFGKKHGKDEAYALTLDIERVTNMDWYYFGL